MSKFRIAIVVGLCLSALVFTMCCKQTKSTTGNAQGSGAAQTGAVTQGIEGRVEVWEGNFMPMVDKRSTNNKITPGAGRRVRVHEPVKAGGGMNSATHETVSTPVVGEAMADSTGHFIIAVSPGTYSVFVEEDGGWYNNGWNDQGIQGAVIVEPDKISNVLIKITTKATF